MSVTVQARLIASTATITNARTVKGVARELAMLKGNTIASRSVTMVSRVDTFGSLRCAARPTLGNPQATERQVFGLTFASAC